MIKLIKRVGLSLCVMLVSLTLYAQLRYVSVCIQTTDNGNGSGYVTIHTTEGIYGPEYVDPDTNFQIKGDITQVNFLPDPGYIFLGIVDLGDYIIIEVKSAN